MDITSIKNFLRAPKPQPPDYVRFLRLLLQGIAVHAVEGDPAELSRFRDVISAISNRLTEDTGSDHLLIEIGAALHALGEFNRRASLFRKANVAELRNIITMMCDTISFLGSSGSSGIQTLQLIEKTLETGSTSVDIRSLRGQLADCFVIVRNESIRVREDTQNQIDMLQSGVQSARDHLASEFSTDPMTGLPGRAAAEQSIANTIAEGLDFAVALFMVDRVESINARFGRTVGDQMIRTMAQRLAQSASQPNSLLRWSGPAFLQVLKVGPDFSAVEQQVKKMALTRVQMNIETDGGSQMLAISCSSLLEKVKKTESAESVFRRLDAFIATRLGAQ